MRSSCKTLKLSAWEIKQIIQEKQFYHIYNFKTNYNLIALAVTWTIKLIFAKAPVNRILSLNFMQTR